MADSATQVVSLPVKGMDCASCALTIEKTLKKVPGVLKCEVNFATEKAALEIEPDKVDIQKLNSKITHLGYSLQAPDLHVMPDGTVMNADEHAEHLGLNKSKTEKLAEIKALKRKMQVLLPLTLAVFGLMLWEIAASSIIGFPKFILPTEVYMPLMFILAAGVLGMFGKPFLKGVNTFIKYRAANMDTLVGIGTGTAFIYSSFILLFPQLVVALNLSMHTYFDVTIIVIGFISFGKYLEATSKVRTGEAIEKLLNLSAKTALIQRNGMTVEVPIERVMSGDIILVKPGAKIPVDGEVVSGKSFVDEAMVTGESMPVEKVIGSSVIGGTINKQGSFSFKATKVGSDTLLAQIIQMVETAQGSRAPIQKLADQISAVFVPAVLIIAIITFAVWLIVGSATLGFSNALPLALSSFIGILVIACPCALGLATPTAIIVGVGKGAQNGILIKNAESLEKLHKVNMIVVDKTGTITKGHPEVTDISILADGFDKAKVMQILSSLEHNSEHPLAAAITEYAILNKIHAKSTDEFQAIEGKGVQAKVGGQMYYAGNVKLIQQLSLEFDDKSIQDFTSQGKTPIILATSNSIIAIVAVADTIKESAKAAIKALHDMRISVVMLTGDDKTTAQYIATQAGIDQVVAEVLPADKANAVREFQQQGYIVGMAGDGINDAPALAQSDVGIAMGTGTDIAIESSDITLLYGDLNKLTQAIKLSRITMRAIRQNLFWAFVYNVVGIPLAAGLFFPLWGILLNPAFAGLAMAFSSVSVVLNSLRLKVQSL